MKENDNEVYKILNNFHKELFAIQDENRVYPAKMTIISKELFDLVIGKDSLGIVTGETKIETDGGTIIVKSGGKVK